MPASFDPINVISGTLNIGSGNIYDIILSDTSGQLTVFNQNKQNIDFAISGTNNFLYYDASTGRLGIGVDDPDTALHVIAPCANDGLKVEGTTNCATGVRLLLLHNPGIATSSGSFPATIDLAGHNTNSQTIYYGQIRSKVLDPVTGSTSGEILFNVDHTGIPITVYRANPVNLALGGFLTADGHNYNAIGSNTITNGSYYVSIGSFNRITTSTGLYVGNMITSNANNSIAVSNVAGLSGTKVILIGNNSFVSGHNNIVIANDSVVSGLNNALVGNNINLAHNTHNIIGLLVNSKISGISGVAFGSNVSSTGQNNIFLGNDNIIVGSNNSIIGSFITLTGNHNLLYGGQSSVSGSEIISVGNSNNPIGVISGLFVGNDIDLSNGSRVIVLGLGNSVVDNLDNSIIVGITNNTSNGTADELVLIGQNNISTNADNSVIIGNNNDASGNFNNSILIGPNNYTSTTSNNNIIVGSFTNNSGLSVQSNGTLVGNGSVRLNNSTINNSTIFGINNLIYSLTNADILGNKNNISGNNLNSIGCFNDIKGTYIQNFGDRNYVLGNHINTFGGRNTVIGASTLVNNPAKRHTWSFGSGNIIFGDNEIIISGLCVGFNNDILGPHNIVYGQNNFIGKTRNPCIILGSNDIVRINGDVRTSYNAGDRILILLASPANQNNFAFNRLISAISYDNVNGHTNIAISELITTQGYPYGIQEAFDDVLSQTTSLSGWCIPFQDGNDITDPIGDPYFGNTNIVIGLDNSYLNSSGIVLGNHNTITGVSNIIIGNHINGSYNRTVQIGLNNASKMVLSDDGIIFNTGAVQDYVLFNSTLGGTTLKADLTTNRIGIANFSPRSTLDVSGTITTSNLRVGLSGIPGYTLHSDSLGNATWQMPVNLSGDNNTILYKYSDKIASGAPELRFIPNSKTFAYLKPGSFDPTVYEDAFALTPSGLYINNSSDNESTYDIVVKGSGDGLILGQHDYNIRVNLLKTLPAINAIQVYNITGISGHFYRYTVTDSMFLPRNLSGTFLRVSSSNGELFSPTTPRNTILFSNSTSQMSGMDNLKYYSTNQAVTIGATGILTDNQSANFQGESDISSNVILCSTDNYGTVINNAGKNKPFSVIDNSFGSVVLPLKKGLHYDTVSGVLGLGVTLTTDMQATNGASATRWYTHDNVKLVVAGKTKTNALQLTPNGGFPADASARYLRADDNGNIQLSNISLNTQFSGIWPLYVDAQVATRVDIGLSTLAFPGAGSSISVGQNGFIFAWDGGRWTNNAKGIRVYQPDFLATDLDTVPGIDIGVDAKSNYCNNTITMAGTSFMNTNSNSNYLGGNQISTFFLKGRTNSADAQATRELVSDFTKDVSSSPTQNNTISVQYFYNPLAENNINASLWEPVSVWQYNIKFCGLAAPIDNITNLETTDYKGVAGSLEGAFIIYRNPADSTKVIRTLGTPSSTVYKDSILSWPNDIVYVTGINTGNAQRLAVYARQLVGYNIMWTATVEIAQLNHPSGVNIAASF
jgi:hypothetical protein